MPILQSSPCLGSFLSSLISDFFESRIRTESGPQANRNRTNFLYALPTTDACGHWLSFEPWGRTVRSQGLHGFRGPRASRLLAIAPALALPKPAANRSDRQATTAPSFGIGIEHTDAAHASALAPWLRELAPRHLHMRIDAADSAAVDWAGIQSLLEAAGARLRLDLTRVPEGGEEQAFARLAMAMTAAGVTPEGVTPFPSTLPVVAVVFDYAAT